MGDYSYKYNSKLNNSSKTSKNIKKQLKTDHKNHPNYKAKHGKTAKSSRLTAHS